MRKCFYSVLAFFACIIMLVIALSAQVKADGDYPEITPDNLSCRYGYNYLGTLENGEIYQKLYVYMDEKLWDFYCSDEEAEIYDYADDGITPLNYVATRFNLSECLTEGEINLFFGSDMDWERFKYWFFMDNPIYYFCRHAYGQDAFPVYDSNNGNWTNDIIVIATTYLDGETYEAINDYGSLANRIRIRNVIQNKLHEYYDLTKDMDTDVEKELAIQEKICRETIYSFEDLTTLDAHSVVGVLAEDSKAVCDGYAQAFTLICNYCGVRCITVDGWALEPHVWNAVYLENEWYCADVTWADSYEDQVGQFENTSNYNMGFYNTSEYKSSDRTSMYLYINVPYSIFSSDRYFEHITNEIYSDGYPSFSDNANFWKVYFINSADEERYNGFTDEELEECSEYVKSEIALGHYVIDIYAWNDDCIDTKGAIANAISEYNEQFDTNYRFQNYGVFSAAGNKIGSADDANFIHYTRVLISEVKTNDNGVQYWKHNVDGSGTGIALTEMPIDSTSVVVPYYLDGEAVKSVFLNGLNDVERINFSNGIRIVHFSWRDFGSSVYLKQVVIPESAIELYIDIATYFSDESKVKSLYVPQNTVSLDIRVDDLSIYGYAGTVAETYATDKNLSFYDLTGKTKIDAINISGFVMPAIGSDDFEVSVDDLQTEDPIVIYQYDIVADDIELQENFKAQIYVEAQSGYAITPNTLCGLDGNIAYITNIDATHAIIEFYFSMPIAKIIGGDSRFEGVRVGNYASVSLTKGKLTNPSYQWKRDGVDIDGQGGNNYLLSPDDIGSTISCRITDEGRSGEIIVELDDEVFASLDINFRNTCQLGNDLSLYYAVSQAELEDYENVRLVCVKRKYDETGNNHTDVAVPTLFGTITNIGNSSYYQFVFTKIAAKEIGDEISAVLYAEKDGITYASQTYEYSIKNYVDHWLENQDQCSDEFKRLLVDMLNYGSAAQTYFNYKTYYLANSGLTDEQRAWGTEAMPELINVKSSVDTANATVEIFSNTIVCGNNIELLFAMRINNSQSMENLKLVIDYVAADGTHKSVTIPSSKFNYESSISAYSGRIISISAKDFGQCVTAKVMDNDNLVSNVQTYSVESYAYEMLPKEGYGESLKYLIRQLIKYGKSAEAYFAAQ